MTWKQRHHPLREEWVVVGTQQRPAAWLGCLPGRRLGALAWQWFGKSSERAPTLAREAV
ncbi:MAG TPA: hypothetical protein VJN18_10490 [Polyangiaceae bacterium]|nr:hypothetical protein [Polyangiaceae bacterium]